MRRRSLLWRLLSTYSAVVLASLIAMDWYALWTLRAYEKNGTAAVLNAHADLASAALTPYVQSRSFADADALCKRMGRETGTRITLIRPDGEVAGDSFEAIARMENHAGRPEVQTATRGERGTDSRVSRTLDEKLTYLAVPIVIDGHVAAVVRASLPLAPIERVASLLHRRIAASVVIGLAIAALSASLTAGWLYRSVALAYDGANRVASGRHDVRLPTRGPREIASLADGINRLVAKLDAHITEANRHRREGEAILASMTEGVLAVNSQARVISMNGAAGGMLGIGADVAAGLPIDEAAPNREVQRFVTETLTHAEPHHGEFSLRARDIVHAQGTPLRDGAGKRIGAVVVLQDVTRVRRLEKVRRDFVANVSHELKSPITAIKGYVETILDSQLHDAAHAKRSMQTVARHAARLNAIIEDLLALSRIEQDEGKGDQRFDVQPLLGVLDIAVAQCEPRAAERQIALVLDCDAELRVRMNAPMLEKAAVHLIENAVRCSSDDSRVEVRAELRMDAAAIHVIDEGCGIEAEHLPRLFERFYRVNTEKSNQASGTGLGLAIVQHIARAHGGSVHVESTPGEGSTFTLELPAAELA